MKYAIQDVLPNRLSKRNSAKWKLRATFTANFENKLQISKEGDGGFKRYKKKYNYLNIHTCEIIF